MRIPIPIKIVLLVELMIIVTFSITLYRMNHKFLENAKSYLVSQGNGLAYGFLQHITTLNAYTPERLKEHAETLTTLCQELYAKRQRFPGLVYVAILDDKGGIVAHYHPELVGTSLSTARIVYELGWQQTRLVLDEGVYHVLVPILNEHVTSYQSGPLSDYAGAIDLGFAQTETIAFFQPLSREMLVVFIIAALIFMPVFWGIVYWFVSRPIAYLAQVGDQIGEGQIIETLHYTTYHDERALLAQTFVKISNYFREVSQLATHIAIGRLEQQEIQKHSKRDILGSALQDMLSYLRTVADIARKVAAGDLTMIVPLRSDYDTFGRALQQMILSLRQMADVATNISGGDLRDQISPRSEHDCLGQAFYSMTMYLQHLAAAATAIATGDLEQDVQPQSEYDVLGNAFHTMAIQLRENFERIQHEVAERTRAQEALQELNAQLEDRVKERTFELSAAYREIQILNHQLATENVRMSAELNVVKQLQQMILPRPQELANIPGLDIVGYMQPADEVGGDYYDVLHDQGLLHIGIGDVTGHGLESGVIMLMTQAAIRTLIEHGETDPVKFVTTLNRLIYKNVERMGADKNMTFVLVQYQGGQFKLVGQHEEALVVRQNRQVERVDTMDLGFPVGLEPEIANWVHTASITLDPGDGLVLYTDGITEAENSEHQQYGLDRLCAVVGAHWNAPVDAIKQAVVDDVLAHIGTQKVYDDITRVVLKQQSSL